MSLGDVADVVLRLGPVLVAATASTEQTLAGE